MSRAATTLRVATRTRQRRVRETWNVWYRDPSGVTVNVELDCLRGTFFREFRRYLTSIGLPSEAFSIDNDPWDRTLTDSYYEPQQPLLPLHSQ